MSLKSRDAENEERLEKVIAILRHHVRLALKKARGADVCAVVRIQQGTITKDSHVKPPQEYPWDTRE